QPAYASEDAAAARLLQEAAQLAAEQLADALADQLERQAVAPQPRAQLGPLLAAALELLGRQQRLGLIHAQSAHPATADGAAEHGQLWWRVAAGQQQAALVRSFAQRLEQPTVASQLCAIAPLLLKRLEQRLDVVQHQQAAPSAQQLQQ